MNQTYQIIPHSFGEPEYREIKGYTLKFVGRDLSVQSSRLGLIACLCRGSTKTAKTRTASTDTATGSGTCLLHDLTQTMELERLETHFKK